ncbi:MAG: glycosyltransferase family 2 protein [Candidatus Omnitrophica bacterium]|nr:glycosyltransferase family 2 protein [Candidatus Omnitrophota bacterium]
MLHQTDKVTFIIFSRDQGELLKSTLVSILNQTYKNIEVFLIVNDLNNKLFEELGVYKHKINFTLNQKNSSRAKILNESLKNATGRYFAVLAAGDVWQPGALAQKVDFLEKNKNAFAVCSDFDVFNKTGIIKNSFFQFKDFFEDKHAGESFLIEEAHSYFINSCHKLFSMMLIRNEVYLFHGPFDERMNGYTDFDLFFKMLSKYKLGCIKKVLVGKFFDAYKISYYLNYNIKERILYLDYLLNDFAIGKRKYEKELKYQIEKNYFTWITYLIKNDEAVAARGAAVEYMQKYLVSPGFLWLFVKSGFSHQVKNIKGRYDYFKMDQLQEDLLKLNY